MPPIQTPAAARFAQRLLVHSVDALELFSDVEILTGRPFIFSDDVDLPRLQRYISEGLEVRLEADAVLIVGSAKTGFSLDPDRFSQPFQASSDIDVVVISAEIFDEIWRAMLAWDYRTINARTSWSSNGFTVASMRCGAAGASQQNGGCESEVAWSYRFLRL